MAAVQDPVQPPTAVDQARDPPSGVDEAAELSASAAALSLQLALLAQALARRHAFLDTPPHKELAIAQGDAGLLAWAMMAGLHPDPALQPQLAAWLRSDEEEGEGEAELEAGGDFDLLLQRGLSALGEMVNSGTLEQRLAKALVLEGEAPPPLSSGVSAWQELSAYLDPLDPLMSVSGVLGPVGARAPADPGSAAPPSGRLFDNDLARDDSYTRSPSDFEADFDAGADGFTYADDAFRATAQPAYADGVYIGAGGFSGGALRVTLGAIDNADILGMSGGWQYQLTLTEASEVEVTFRYNLTHAGPHENDEYAEVMFSFDGVLYGSGANDYVERITGDGNAGPDLTTGWQSFTVDLGLQAAGNHTIFIGGYSNKKTFNDEWTEVLIDEVTVTDSGALIVTAAEGLLANDVPRNGLQLSALLEDGPDNGSLSLAADGSFSYTPNVGFTGTDSFDYSVTDGIMSDLGRVTLEVL